MINLFALTAEITGIDFNKEIPDLTEEKFHSIVNTIYENLTYLQKWDIASQSFNLTESPTVENSDGDSSDEECSNNDAEENVDNDVVENMDNAVRKVANFPAHEVWNEDGVLNFHCGQYFPSWLNIHKFNY